MDERPATKYPSRIVDEVLPGVIVGYMHEQYGFRTGIVATVQGTGTVRVVTGVTRPHVERVPYAEVTPIRWAFGREIEQLRYALRKAASTADRKANKHTLQALHAARLGLRARRGGNEEGETC